MVGVLEEDLQVRSRLLELRPLDGQLRQPAANVGPLGVPRQDLAVELGGLRLPREILAALQQRIGQFLLRDFVVGNDHQVFLIFLDRRLVIAPLLGLLRFLEHGLGHPRDLRSLEEIDREAGNDDNRDQDHQAFDGLGPHSAWSSTWRNNGADVNASRGCLATILDSSLRPDPSNINRE